MAARIGAQFIDSDDYANAYDDPPGYVECLRLDELRQEIEDAIARGAVVLAGVCSAELWPGPSVSIYIKRMSFSTPEWPIWFKEFQFDDPLPLIQPHRSIMQYHLTHRPHDIADLVLELPDLGQTLEGTIPR